MAPDHRDLAEVAIGEGSIYHPVGSISTGRISGSQRLNTAQTANPSFTPSIDNQCLGGQEMLYTGLCAYKGPGGPSIALGGMEVIDLQQKCAVHQVPVQLWFPATGAVMTQNPSYFELMPDDRIRAYFMPDDNESTIFVYEA